MQQQQARLHPQCRILFHRNLQRRRRAGLGAFEVLISVALLSVVLSLAAGMSTAAVQHRRALERQRVSVQAASNLIQLAMALPYAELSTARLVEVAETMPLGASEGSKWRISVDESTAVSKRIAVELVWDAVPEIEAPNAPLVAFRYALAGSRNPTDAASHDIAPEDDVESKQQDSAAGNGDAP